MSVNILWADDEIELLKPHIMFLEQKGYEVATVTNGADAVEKVENEKFDIVFLDENMPGLTGLETLTKIKEINNLIPVIMITKSEEEHIMEDAIGGKISDYLIKPVNPNQILLSLKKNLDERKLVSEKTSSNYQREFRDLGMRINDRLDWEEWIDVYKKLIYWDLELEKSGDQGMQEVLKMQKTEANSQFSRFIEDNYLEWTNEVSDDIPPMSNSILKNWVFPIADQSPLFLIVIDNLRQDQWKVLKPLISPYFNIDEEKSFFSILPTATHYARNTLFSGLMPSEMEKKHRDIWLNEDEEGGKNMHEQEFLEGNLKRNNKSYKTSYNKITNLNSGKKLVDNFNQLENNHLNVIVYNFVDMLSHARTEMEVIKELADDEAAYRSLTRSWFEHSPLKEVMVKIAEKGFKMIITTDHGTVRVDEPVKIVGDRNTNTNLRYKVGRGLSYNEKEVFRIKNPEEGKLPQHALSSEFVFAKNDQFFVYPNNYNHYVSYYRDTFQHGGISMEEIIIPFVICSAK
ncbi:MAG: PglZ domain-containing protein [Crocinitomicaceae bacterium]